MYNNFFHFNYFFSVKLSGTNHLHIVVQPSRPSSPELFFYHPMLNLYTLNNTLHFSLTLAPSSYFLSLWIWLVWVPQISGTIQYLSFFDIDLFHLVHLQGSSTLEHLSEFHSILRLNNISSCVYIPFFYSFICWYLECSYLLAIVNSVSLNIGIQIYVGVIAFQSFEFIFVYGVRILSLVSTH